MKHTTSYPTILGLVGLLCACRSNIPPVGTPVIVPEYAPLQYDGPTPSDLIRESISPPTFLGDTAVSNKTIKELLTFTDSIDARDVTLLASIRFSVDENGILTISDVWQSHAIRDQIKRVGNKLLDSIKIVQPAHLVNDINTKTPYFFYVWIHINQETVTFRIIDEGNRSLLNKIYTRPLY